MCGRYVLKREDLEALVRQFGLRSLEEFHSRYNIAPTSIVPLIRTRGPGEPEEAITPAKPEVAGVRWGLIPRWTKADGPVRPIVNVRAETLVSRANGTLRARRCVLPGSGFYEWEDLGSKKQPWFFACSDNRPFGFAGVWDTWRASDGTALETCAILTTRPNASVAPIHDRMPVMLTPEQCEAWIRTSAADLAELGKLLEPAPDAMLVALKVGPAVSNVRNDGPECIAPAPDDPDDPQSQLSLAF